MRCWNSNFVAGIAAITFMLSFVGYCTGIGNAIELIYLWVLTAMIPRLWNSPLRIIAIVLLPAILLQYLLPKSLRAAVNALPRADLSEKQ